MTRWNTKKIVLALILLLVGCDVSLLFAAQSNGTETDAASQQQMLQQVQQLRQQLQQPASPQQQPQIQQPAAATSLPPGQIAEAPQPVPASAAFGATIGAGASSAPPVPGAVSAATGGANPAGLPPATTAATGAAPGMVTEDQVNQAAFEAMAKSTLPMSPEQIQRLRQLFNQTQFAASSMPGIPPRPVISSQSVNLAPGSTPPAVRLQQGMVSVIGFLDSTGAPWPIEAYDIGNPSAFNIQWNKQDNTLIIQPMTLYTYGNLAVKLQGMPTPIILMLFPGQKVFDSRLDFHVSGLGPNARPMASSGLPNSADPDLLSILDGVPPAGSITLHVSGGECQAWAAGERLFVRTRLTILSPGWIATMSSADGMRAYEIPKPSAQTPVLLASDNGKIIQLKVEGL